MLILPWTTTTFWTVMALSAPSIICYLLILPALCKNKKLVLLAILTSSLLLSQLFFLMFMVFEKNVYDAQLDDQTPTRKTNIFNALAYTFLGLFYVLFCVSYWVFVMKYWVIARTMQKISNKTKPKPYYVENFIYYGILFLNVAFPIYDAVERGMDLPMNGLSFELLIGIQVVSCIFLFDALRRIVTVTRKDPNSKINVKALTIHAGSYLLYLLTQIYFFI